MLHCFPMNLLIFDCLLQFHNEIEMVAKTDNYNLPSMTRPYNKDKIPYAIIEYLACSFHQVFNHSVDKSTKKALDCYYGKMTDGESADAKQRINCFHQEQATVFDAYESRKMSNNKWRMFPMMK